MIDCWVISWLIHWGSVADLHWFVATKAMAKIFDLAANALFLLSFIALTGLWTIGLVPSAMADGRGVRCWGSKDNPGTDLLTLCFEAPNIFSGARFKNQSGIDFGGTYTMHGQVLELVLSKLERPIACMVEQFDERRLQLTGCEFSGNYLPIPPAAE